MKLGLILILAGFGLCACATGPDVYARQPWATISQDQAEAECEVFLTTGPGMTSTMFLCMKAKGYVGS